jgi:prepilin-type N-terminal cleavage/methylation domain-containing protein
MPLHDERGFTLIEALVATALLALVIAGLAHLGLLAVAQSVAVEHQEVALRLAQGKLEELWAGRWTVDASGTPVSDPALALSPDDALTTAAAGYVDRFDRFGAPVAAGSPGIYERRWAISLVSPADPETLLMRACVVARAPALRSRAAADACVTTIRTRQP